MRKDLTGQIINNWQILYIFDCGANKSTKYMCRCTKCGAEKVVVGSTISTGKSKMCRKCSAKIATRRKWTDDPIKHVYSGMLQRCYYSGHKSYSNYGGRGIVVCDEWKRDRESFYEWAYSNGYVKGLTIERIDVNGNYCPENCTFIPKSEQSKNRRNINAITIGEKTKCLSEWCRIYHANPDSIKKLHNSGIEWEAALEMKRNTSSKF